jgi:hypothetical protein
LASILVDPVELGVRAEPEAILAAFFIRPGPQLEGDEVEDDGHPDDPD